MALYFAAVFFIGLLAGGMVYTITYDILNQIYAQVLPTISMAGGLTPNEVLSTNLMLDVWASIPALIFIVGWIYLLTKLQKPQYEYG